MKLKRLKVHFIFPAALLLAGCAPEQQSAVHPLSHFRPTATIQDIMQSIIDPNIDPVWNSVATISTTAGTIEKSPESDEEWKVVRQHALVVVEASNLLIMEGRDVAPPGASTSSHAVELSPAEIRKGIDSNREAFNARAQVLHDATVEALAAINARNTGALVEAGGKIDQACEQCHTQFWYPNDKRPI